MENYNDNMEIIYGLMPEGWREAAKTEKALLIWQLNNRQ